MKHKHYDVLVQWLSDQTLSLEYKASGNWFTVNPVEDNPITDPNSVWRIKPKMVRVGRHEWPMPLKVVPEESVWAWSFEYEAIQELKYDSLKQKAVAQGVAHLTKEAAQQHADALVAINRGDV